MATAAKKKAGTAVVPAKKVTAPVAAEDYGEDAGLGFEGTTREDYAIPFLVVLQALHPQCEKGNAKHIEGAEAGMILNTVTNDLYDGDEGIVVIPVHRAHKFIEWVPRDSGGGLVAIHEPDSEFVRDARRANKKFGRIELPESGTELTESFSVFAIHVREEGVLEQVLINFGSSMIKTYKQWMTRMGSIQIKVKGQTIRPPMWAHRYRLVTKLNKNKKGSWYAWSIGFDGNSAEEARLAMDHPQYIEAKAFRQIAAVEETRAVERATRAAEGAGVRDAGGDEEEEGSM